MKGLVGTSWFGEDMCHEYSNCEYEDKFQMFKCKCKDGYHDLSGPDSLQGRVCSGKKTFIQNVFS